MGQGHPSEKYEFVNWDDDSNPLYMGKCQNHGNQSPPTRKFLTLVKGDFSQRKPPTRKLLRNHRNPPRPRGFRGFLSPGTALRALRGLHVLDSLERLDSHGFAKAVLVFCVSGLKWMINMGHATILDGLLDGFSIHRWIFHS